MAVILPALLGLAELGAVGTALLSGAVSIGLSALAKQLAPEPTNQNQGSRGMRLSLKVESNADREAAFGIVASAGSLHYHNSYGPNGTDYVQLVYVLADHECDSLVGIEVDGVTCTLGSFASTAYASGLTVAEYPNAMWVQFHSGAWDQAADTDLIAHSPAGTTLTATTVAGSAVITGTDFHKLLLGQTITGSGIQSGTTLLSIQSDTSATLSQTATGSGTIAIPLNGWTAADRGRGVCYVRVTLYYNPELYKSGQPHLLFIFKGGKQYDLRKDSTAGGSGAHRWADPSTHEWTDNPAVCLYNFRRGITVNGQRLVGLSTPADCLPVDAWTSAAAICDEAVNRLLDGPEKRYRAAGLVSTSADNRSTVREFVTATGGSEIDSGGIVRLLPGAAQTPVIYLTDDDLMSDDDVEITPKLSRSDLANAIFGTFHDPLAHYESTALPPRISSADEVLDGGIELQKHFTLDFCPSATQGQRILEIFRRRERYQRRVKARFRSRCAVLEAGDWVSWTSARYGFDSQTFEVISATLNADMTVPLALRDVDGTIYSWAAADDEITGNVTHDLGTGGATFSQVQGFSAGIISIAGANGSSRPGLAATWTPVTDVTTITLEIEYRKLGDTVALSLMVFDPAAGNHAWITGVQGGVTYQVRIRPVTNPVRSTQWTSWVSTPSVTNPQLVDVASSVPPGSITIDKLSPEAVASLQLSAAVSDALDAIDLRLVTAENSIALKTDASGNVIGAVKLDGTGASTSFIVVANKFLVAQPGTTGGTATPIFEIANVNGTPSIVLKGNILADGSIQAQHLSATTITAIAASINTITAGRIVSTNGLSYLDLRAGQERFRMVTAP